MILAVDMIDQPESSTPVRRTTLFDKRQYNSSICILSGGNLNIRCGVVEVPALAQMDTLDDLSCTRDMLPANLNCDLFTATLCPRSSHTKEQKS